MDADDDRPLDDHELGDAAREDEALAPTALRDEDRLALVCAYLGPLCLIPLFGSRDPFVRWHARQGGWLATAGAVVAIVLTPFDWLFSLVPFLDRLFFAAELLVALGYLMVVAMSVERALAGRRFRIPWLADLADQD
ncbi:MAG: hypothetical protein JSV80_14715 [Acidobacteriota bacterium]|nr:MAG: hypothetical protein JSV80_14715 [Acidobacteriota bacterium]